VHSKRELQKDLTSREEGRSSVSPSQRRGRKGRSGRVPSRFFRGETQKARAMCGEEGGGEAIIFSRYTRRKKKKRKGGREKKGNISSSKGKEK